MGIKITINANPSTPLRLLFLAPLSSHREDDTRADACSFVPAALPGGHRGLRSDAGLPPQEMIREAPVIVCRQPLLVYCTSAVPPEESSDPTQVGSVEKVQQNTGQSPASFAAAGMLRRRPNAACGCERARRGEMPPMTDDQAPWSTRSVKARRGSASSSAENCGRRHSQVV